MKTFGRFLPRFLLPCLMLLAACGQKPDDRSWQTAPVAAGDARLVLFYPPKSVGTDGDIDVGLNGNEACRLAPGTYWVGSAPAGNILLRLTYCGMPGVTRASVTADAGQTYYLRITPYDSSLTGIWSGYPSENVPDGADAHQGPFHIIRVGEAAALKELEGYRQAKH